MRVIKQQHRDYNGCELNYAIFIGNYNGYMGVVEYNHNRYYPLISRHGFTNYHDCKLPQDKRHPSYQMKDEVVGDMMDKKKFKIGEKIIFEEGEWVKC